ncbi:MAG: DoxX family membrane protein [Bdellovibrionia bacterium]
MLLAFFESIKYVGHLLPVSFLRIYLGYYYFQLALAKYSGDFLTRPRIADQIAEWLPASQAPVWYKALLNSYFIPHWQTVAFAIVGIEFAIGISYLLGYVVRPIALLAAFFALNLMFMSGPQQEELLKTFFAIHIILAWIGAGRCLGLDYYFYKRRRGLWW